MCGDSWAGPRDNEAGGKYANGIIARYYEIGDVIDVGVEITQNHKGWFEFRLCPNDDVKKPVTHSCLDKYLLEVLPFDYRSSKPKHKNTAAVSVLKTRETSTSRYQQTKADYVPKQELPAKFLTNKHSPPRRPSKGSGSQKDRPHLTRSKDKYVNSFRSEGNGSMRNRKPALKAQYQHGTQGKQEDRIRDNDEKNYGQVRTNQNEKTETHRTYSSSNTQDMHKKLKTKYDSEKGNAHEKSNTEENDKAAGGPSDNYQSSESQKSNDRARLEQESSQRKTDDGKYTAGRTNTEDTEKHEQAILQESYKRIGKEEFEKPNAHSDYKYKQADTKYQTRKRQQTRYTSDTDTSVKDSEIVPSFERSSTTESGSILNNTAVEDTTFITGYASKIPKNTKSVQSSMAEKGGKRSNSLDAEGSIEDSAYIPEARNAEDRIPTPDDSEVETNIAEGRKLPGNGVLKVPENTSTVKRSASVIQTPKIKRSPKMTRYYLQASQGNGLVRIKLRLPQGLSCKQCVLQWKYNAGENQ